MSDGFRFWEHGFSVIPKDLPFKLAPEKENVYTYPGDGFQSLDEAIDATDGSLLFIKPGTHTIHRPHVVENLRIRGAGYGTGSRGDGGTEIYCSKKFPEGATALSVRETCDIRDLTMFGWSRNVTGIALGGSSGGSTSRKFHNSRKVNIEHVRLDHFGGVALEIKGPAFVQTIVLYDLLVTNCNSGLKANNVIAAQFRSMSFEGCKTPAVFDHVRDCMWIGGTVESNNTPVKILGGTHHFTISGIHFEDNPGVLPEPGKKSCWDPAINDASNPGPQFLVDGPPNKHEIEGVHIIDCRMSNSDGFPAIHMKNTRRSRVVRCAFGDRRKVTAKLQPPPDHIRLTDCKDMGVDHCFAHDDGEIKMP